MLISSEQHLSKDLLEFSYFAILFYKLSRTRGVICKAIRFVDSSHELCLLQCLPTNVELGELRILPICVGLDERSRRLKVSTRVTPYACPHKPCVSCPFALTLCNNNSRSSVNIVLEHLLGGKCLYCQDRVFRKLALDVEVHRRSLVLGCPTAVISLNYLRSIGQYTRPNKPLMEPEKFILPGVEQVQALAEYMIAVLLAAVIHEFSMLRNFEILKPGIYYGHKELLSRLPDIILIDYEHKVIIPIDIAAEDRRDKDRIELTRAERGADVERAFITLYRELKSSGIIQSELEVSQCAYKLILPSIRGMSYIDLLKSYTGSRVEELLHGLAESIRKAFSQ